MNRTQHILGIRHHGPGSTRTLLAALEEVHPSMVLIECPADAQSALEWVRRDDLVPPVALLVHDAAKPINAVYYPFAEFSPEWQAIRWAHRAGVEVRCMDLAHAQRPEETGDAGSAEEARAEKESGVAPVGERDRNAADSVDPLSLLAQSAGYDDGERWWDAVIEHRRARVGAVRAFGAVAEAMIEVRSAIESNRAAEADGLPDVRESRAVERLREAHMRQSIRQAARAADGPIAVVCGAYHVPALLGLDGRGDPRADEDEAMLRGLPRRKTAALWVPWTASRLTMASGYGAGIEAPGWYAHLWRHEEATTERWMARITQSLRREGLDATPAHAIAAADLALTLASLRGHALATLDDMTDAARAVHAYAGPACMALIHDRVIVGEEMGQVPEDAPTTPLAADLAAQQKSLRLKPESSERVLDLDLRTDLGRARSVLLHRVRLLGVPWGKEEASAMRNVGTFRETWRLMWEPEFAVLLIEASVLGTTVGGAASSRAIEAAREATGVDQAAKVIRAALAADLPEAAEAAIARLDHLAATKSDVGSMLDALPQLAWAARYGDVRRTNSGVLLGVTRAMCARVTAGLSAACLGLDDDGGALMASRIDAAHAAMGTLSGGEAPVVDESAWRRTLGQTADAHGTHGLVAGRAARLLHDDHAEDHATERRLALALAHGGDPARAAAWIDGFLGGSAMLLLHDDQLWSLVRVWIASLSGERFDAIVPVLRRAFARFAQAERARVGQRIRQAHGRAAAAEEALATFHADRAERALATVRLILGLEEPAR